MKRFWGAALGFSLFGILYADTLGSALRTPHGMLWAGTTFTLQAIASHGDALVSHSEPAQVRVGQVYEWQLQVIPPTGMSIRSGDGLFRFHLTNLGNGFDRIEFTGWRWELTETPVWELTLFEDRNGNGIADSSEQVNPHGSLIAPTQGVVYMVRARPPSHSTVTDGVWIGVAARSASGQGAHRVAEYIAGVLRPIYAHSRGYSYGNHYIYVPAVLYGGRLFWMATESTSSRTRIFYTPNRLDLPGGTLRDNRALYERPLNFVPSGFSALVENSWFVGTADRRLLRVDMTRVLGGDTSSDPFQQVMLPGGVQPRLDLQPIVYRSRLYLVGDDNRIHVLSSAGIWITQSARPSNAVGTISCPPLLTSRAIVVGTSSGYVVAFDLLTGGIRLARQVGTEAIRSLAMTRDERYLLVHIGDRRLAALTTSQGTTFWSVSLPEAMVSPLVYEPFTDSVLVMTRSGWLYAFNGATGTPCPHYPQQIFSGQPLQRATIATLRRADRKSPYAYVLAQQEVSGSSATQTRMAIVAVLNPYNRYEVPDGQLGQQSDHLPAILFTGDAVGSLCLVFQRQAYAGTNTQGIVSAFQVQ
ncbi:MAG: hypothetical protein ABDI19_10870 [Armatimonadota bacterium]